MSIQQTHYIESRCSAYAGLKKKLIYYEESRLKTFCVGRI
jgi:hypothetical protein